MSNAQSPEEMMQLVLRAAFALATRAQGGPPGRQQSKDAEESSAEHSKGKW